MNIKFRGKTYTGSRDNLTGNLSIKVGSKKMFAGFGVNNMVRGFRIVNKPAPKKALEAHEKAD